LKDHELIATESCSGNMWTSALN